MHKFLRFLTFPAIIILIAGGIYLYFQPEITTRKGKAVIKTNTTHLFVPSINPLEVYAFDPESEELNQILAAATQNTKADFGIFVKNLNTKQQGVLNPDQQFTSASLYKLFVMYTIFDKGAKGELDLDRNEVQDNLEAMITVSSNEAALYLVDRYTSWEEITDKMHQLGLTQTDLTGEDLVTTPSDVAKLLELMADGKAVDFDSSVKMLELMTEQTRRDRIPAPLPDEALVANKTGELDDVLHDAAVVGTNKSDYIIVVMSKDSARIETTRDTIRKVSEDVYKFFNE